MASPSHLPEARPTPRVRLATLADKEAWITANISGYELDPQFTWRYTKRKEFPEDARKGTGEVFETVLGVESMTCLVAELPKIEEVESGSTEWVVVAIAVWEWKDLEEVESESGE
jgi:hypothetical protein